MIYLIATLLLAGLAALAWQNGRAREQYERETEEAELLRKRNDENEKLYRARPVDANDAFKRLRDKATE